MKKPCCIDDTNISPKNSSCSMVLRSDCSHGHSCKSLVIHDENKLELIPDKRKSVQHLVREKLYVSDSLENSSQVCSYLQSSLQQFKFKSAKTFSFLKENIYSRLDYSENQSGKSLTKNSLQSEFKEESYITPQSIHSFINNNSICQEECNNINNCSIKNYHMSSSRESIRSTSAANALSDSEIEDGPLLDKVRRRRSNQHKHLSSKTESFVSNNHSTTRTAYHQAHSLNSSKKSHSSIINNNNYATPSCSTAYNTGNKDKSVNYTSLSSSPSSPVIDISTVQYTPVDRVRWFLWRTIYLKIIKCVNFDVWLLSRLQNYRRLVILLILLPFLAYLLYGALLRESQHEKTSQIGTNVISFISYIYSLISSPFIYSKDFVSESSLEIISVLRKLAGTFCTVILAVLNFFSNFFVTTNQNVFVKNNPTPSKLKEGSAVNNINLNFMIEEIIEKKLEEIVLKIESQKIQTNKISFNDEKVVLLEDVNRIQKVISNIRLEFQSHAESIQRLEKHITPNTEGLILKDENISEALKARVAPVEAKVAKLENLIKSTSQYEQTIKLYNNRIESINVQLKHFEEKLDVMAEAIKKCDEKWTTADFSKFFDERFLSALKNIIDGEKESNSPYSPFYEWLHTKTSINENLSQQLQSELEKLHRAKVKFDDSSIGTIEKVVQQYMESVRKNLTTHSQVKILSEGNFSLDIVKLLIKEAIMLYDADKTGLVDYALESGGGSILSTRCSENYAEKDGTLSVLGFSLWSTHNSPRTAIQPDMNPGQCWAFKGSQGFLVIQLAYTIHPTGFTLEHIPVSLSPSGSIDSAPREFSVWGLISEKDNEGFLLGKYSYNQDGDPMQYFEVQHTHDEPFSYVELKIHSNHGNLEYTCLYRFRVHGNKPKH